MIKYIFGALLVVSGFCNAQTVFGKWVTVDDETGKERSVVEIYENNGKVYGKIIKILNANKQNVKCESCKGDKKNQPILGMVIIEGLVKNDEVYEDGTILNPDNGKLYKCRLKLTENSNQLQVRGYVAFFYKTQYWKKLN